MISKSRILDFSALFLALVLASPALRAEGASVDEASQAQLKAATAAYERGLDAMDAEKYSEALEQFRQSFATVSSPNSQMMVGRALVKLGRLPEAHAEFRRALQQAKYLAATQQKYQKTVESTQQELDGIKDKLAYVMVPAGATPKIQGKTVGPWSEDEPYAVMPGAVTIEVTYADGTTQSKTKTLNGGEKTKLPPQTVSPQTGTSSSPGDKHGEGTESHHDGDLGMSRKTLGYIVGGVGVVGVATFVGVGLLAASVYGDPKHDCSSNRCPPAALDNQASKSMARGIGWAGLGMGVAGLGIGAWLVFGSGSDKAKPTTALQMGPGMVQLHHRF
jgi:hypothetical protein